MADIVENNVVKMEWRKDGWLEFKARKNADKTTFVFASQVYPSTTKGEVTVFFTSSTAFLFASEPGTENEDMWNAKELAGIMKKGFSDYFPYNYEEYVAVIDSGEENCIASVLERYGIVDAKEDIEARMRDIKPFGYEKIINL